MLTSACATRVREPLPLSLKAAASDVRRTNINSASADELEMLPGIGRVIAERIVKHRSDHGPFRRVEHVMLVRGISERKFLDIKPLITVH
ncbi:MAG TPA: helix-hairpin-helix domain-containing protein [Pyrinomonadaceae bacterium]